MQANKNKITNLIISYKDILLLTVLLLIATLIIFSPFINDYLTVTLTGGYLPLDKIFFIKCDWMEQHVPFYSEFFELLKSGELGWSWNQFMGINFYASKAYYLIGDPFAYLAFLISFFVKYIPNIFMIITVIKIFVAGYSFNYYLSKLNIDAKYRIFLALFYAFGGWFTVFIEHPVFISFYCLVPLLLAGFENVLQKNKYGLVIISASLLLMINYYFTWMLCIYLLFYWICRYLVLNKDFDFKVFMIKSLKMLSIFCVAVLISSVIWFPSILHLLDSPRISDFNNVEKTFFSYNDLFMIIKAFFVPQLKFNDMVYRNDWYAFFQIGIYCGLPCLILVPQMFYSKDFLRKEKLVYGLLLLGFICTLTLPAFGKIFHFTYSLRYSMLVSILILTLSALTLARIKSINKKMLIITSALMLIILYVVGILFAHNIGVYESIEITIVNVALCLIVIYTIILFLCKKNCEYLFVLLLVIGSIEVCYFQNLAIKGHHDKPLDFFLYENELRQVLDELHIKDDSNFRIVIDGMESNVGTYYNEMVASTYDSVYQYSQVKFMTYMRQYPEVSWRFKIKDYNLFDIANVKYIVAYNESEDDSAYYGYIGKKLDVDSELFNVYQVNDQSQFARIIPNIMKKSEFEVLTNELIYYIHDATIPLNNNIIVDDEYYEEFKEKYSGSSTMYYEPVIFENNYIELNVDIDKPSILMLSMPFDKGWKVQVNGKVVKPLDVNGGLMAIELEEKNNLIKMNFYPRGLKLALFVSLSTIICCLLFYSKKYLLISKLLSHLKNKK